MPKRKLAPRDARTEKQLGSIRSYRPGSLFSLEVYPTSVCIYSGQLGIGAVRIPRRTFEAMMRFYNEPQEVKDEG